jgi:[ribosomal protein S5]-alanine N-acetyltransferase
MVLDGILLRRPELRDIPQLYIYRNDAEITQLLGGFSRGYSLRDLEDWIEFHRKLTNEIIWIIADQSTDTCLGHVGLYNIDNRIRKAEFAILIGDKASWGKGLGKRVSQAVIHYGFSQLNLHRIQLEVLANNQRAIELYEKLGFKHEGLQRDAQYRSGQYLDVINMAILERE